MIRDLTIFTCTMALITTISPCNAHSRPGNDIRRASTGEIYFQPTPPLEAKEGELWVDSRNGNQFYFLNGAWTFEDMGTTIARGQTGHRIQMAAELNAAGRRSSENQSKQHTTMDGHEQNKSDLTALHEPHPLKATDENEMTTINSGDQSTAGVSATSVMQTTFGSSENAPNKPIAGPGNRNTQNTATSQSDGPHMSLTDALNADELVDLLRSIGAAH